MQTEFVKADSMNLPNIDSMMVAKFFACNPDFCSAEFRNVKTSLSTRESYGDDAIGYVQLQRTQNTCIIKCTICPEHKVRSKSYSVTLIVDEQEDDVLQVTCHDCPASSGGCKHAIAFLMWCHRRSEEPSCTSIQCYWKKSTLAKIGSSIKVITTKDMIKKKIKTDESKRIDTVTSVVNNFLTESKKRKITTCQYLKHQNVILFTKKLICSLYIT
nr:uncharacterized protein LOC113397863 [Vanessa tameamea]